MEQLEEQNSESANQVMPEADESNVKGVEKGKRLKKRILTASAIILLCVLSFFVIRFCITSYIASMGKSKAQVIDTFHEIYGEEVDATVVRARGYRNAVDESDYLTVIYEMKTKINNKDICFQCRYSWDEENGADEFIYYDFDANVFSYFLKKAFDGTEVSILSPGVRPYKDGFLPDYNKVRSHNNIVHHQEEYIIQIDNKECDAKFLQESMEKFFLEFEKFPERPADIYYRFTIWIPEMENGAEFEYSMDISHYDMTVYWDDFVEQYNNLKNDAGYRVVSHSTYKEKKNALAEARRESLLRVIEETESTMETGEKTEIDVLGFTAELPEAWELILEEDSYYSYAPEEDGEYYKCILTVYPLLYDRDMPMESLKRRLDTYGEMEKVIRSQFEGSVDNYESSIIADSHLEYVYRISIDIHEREEALRRYYQFYYIIEEECAYVVNIVSLESCTLDVDKICDDFIRSIRIKNKDENAGRED